MSTLGDLGSYLSDDSTEPESYASAARSTQTYASTAHSITPSASPSRTSVREDSGWVSGLQDTAYSAFMFVPDVCSRVSRSFVSWYTSAPITEEEEYARRMASLHPSSPPSVTEPTNLSRSRSLLEAARDTKSKFHHRLNRVSAYNPYNSRFKSTTTDPTITTPTLTSVPSIIRIAPPSGAKSSFLSAWDPEKYGVGAARRARVDTLNLQRARSAAEQSANTNPTRRHLFRENKPSTFVPPEQVTVERASSYPFDIVASYAGSLANSAWESANCVNNAIKSELEKRWGRTTTEISAAPSSVGGWTAHDELLSRRSRTNTTAPDSSMGGVWRPPMSSGALPSARLASGVTATRSTIVPTGRVVVPLRSALKAPR